MELLMIILNKEEHLEKITSIITEIGVNAASILESEGVGHFLAFEVPIFAGLRHMMGERKTANRIILGLIEKDLISNFKKMLLREKIDFNDPDVGIAITLPINSVMGS